MEEYMAPDAFFEGDNIMTKTPFRLLPPFAITENWAQVRGVAAAWNVGRCHGDVNGCIAPPSSG